MGSVGLLRLGFGGEITPKHILTSRAVQRVVQESLLVYGSFCACLKYFFVSVLQFG